MSLRGDRLRQVREERQLSQRDLGELCGIDHVLIYRYEKGLTDPLTKQLVNIANKLDVSLDYLVGRSDDPRVQIGSSDFNQEEQNMVQVFRREGWPGIFRLAAEKFPKSG